MYVIVSNRESKRGWEEAASRMKGAALTSVSHWWKKKNNYYGDALMWTRWVGASAWILLLGNWASALTCQCLIVQENGNHGFLRQHPVSVALGLISRDVLLLSSDFDGHQSPFELFCWRGWADSGFRAETWCFCFDSALADSQHYVSVWAWDEICLYMCKCYLYDWSCIYYGRIYYVFTIWRRAHPKCLERGCKTWKVTGRTSCVRFVMARLARGLQHTASYWCDGHH